MKQPQQRRLLNLPRAPSRSQSQGFSRPRNRGRSTTTDFEEEMRTMPAQSIGRRYTTLNIPMRSPNRGTRTDFDPTAECLERLYQVTDIVLIICGIVIIIACVMSIVIGILGITGKLQGLDYYKNILDGNRNFKTM